MQYHFTLQFCKPGKSLKKKSQVLSKPAEHISWGVPKKLSVPSALEKGYMHSLIAECQHATYWPSINEDELALRAYIWGKSPNKKKIIIKVE